MAAICPDFKRLGIRISDPIQNSEHMQTNLFSSFEMWTSLNCKSTPYFPLNPSLNLISRSNVLLELFEQIIHEPCFDVLRTKEQLGYIVYSGVSQPRGVQSFRIIVQSTKKPDFLDQRIELFLWSMRKHIENLSDEEFEKNKTSLADRILEKPKKLSSRSSKFW